MAKIFLFFLTKSFMTFLLPPSGLHLLTPTGFKTHIILEIQNTPRSLQLTTNPALLLLLLSQQTLCATRSNTQGPQLTKSQTACATRAEQQSTFSEPRRWSQPHPPPLMQPYCPRTIRATPSSSFFHFNELPVFLTQNVHIPPVPM